MRIPQSSWTPDEVAKLIELANKGATLIRAAAALKKPQIAVRRKAAMLGRFLPSFANTRSGDSLAGIPLVWSEDD